MNELRSFCLETRSYLLRLRLTVSQRLRVRRLLHALLRLLLMQSHVTRQLQPRKLLHLTALLRLRQMFHLVVADSRGMERYARLAHCTSAQTIKSYAQAHQAARRRLLLWLLSRQRDVSAETAGGVLLTRRTVGLLVKVIAPCAADWTWTS